MNLANKDTGELHSEVLEQRAKGLLNRSHYYLRIANDPAITAPVVYQERAIVSAETATYYFKAARRYRLKGE